MYSIKYFETYFEARRFMERVTVIDFGKEKSGIDKGKFYVMYV